MNDNQIQPGQSFTPGQQSQSETAPLQQPIANPAPVPTQPSQIPIQGPPLSTHQINQPTTPPIVSTQPGHIVQAAEHTTLVHEKEEGIKKGDKEAAEVLEPEETLVSWNAPEFTYISKPAGWYGILALVCIMLTGGFLFFKQWMAAVLVLVMGASLGVVAGRRPRVLNYSITNYGIYIGQKAYPFDSFKAHYEGNDYGQKVLELVPTKRFAPMISMPVIPANHDDVFAMIEEVIPKTEPTNSLVDKIFTYLRF